MKAGNHLLGIVQRGFRLILLALAYQLLHELGEDTAMRVTHTHRILVNVDTRLVDTTELELVHQVVVHLFAINLHTQFVRIERSETVGKTFLNEVVAHIQLVLRP